MRTEGIECKCSDCDYEFVLAPKDVPADEFKPAEVKITIAGSESAGVYLAYVKCPRCGHEHEVY